ncbi:MAG TPA: complex I subunit 5 family protein [Pseudonocardiaceae bacterium]|nr:complex I subunit 5 family protein [Pseudonocardiaceae bacterium]
MPPLIEALPALVVALPLLAATGLAAAGRVLPRVVIDVVSVLTCLLVLSGSVVLLDTTGSQRIVSWLGGYPPRHGASVGVVFVVDRIGAGLTTLIAALVAAALIYTWRYFDEVESYFHVLVLLFLTGMTGFALTGDLFNAFVFFELMGAVAYALTGYKIEEAKPLQGALNFAMINSLGAYCALLGVGLIYGRTGELGFAQVQRALAGQRGDWLIAAAATLVFTGFLVKAAAVPFHFWLADAHAVAPSPVCVLFSGVMVELGLYGVARTWSAAFSPVLPAERLSAVLMVTGVVTAVAGAVMCLVQSHLKRLLAFSTIGHVGVFLVALGALRPDAVGGLVVYVLGHAAVKGALFLCTGILLNTRGSVDEAELHGRGRDMPITRICFLAGGLALAALPPFGTWLGKTVAEDGLSRAGFGWAGVLFVGVSACTGGAVLRAGMRVFLGVGAPPDTEGDTRGRDEHRETDQDIRQAPATMLVPIVVLLSGGLILGLLPGMATHARDAAQQLLDPAGYAAAALDGARAVPPAGPTLAGWSTSGLLLGLLSAVLAMLVATVALYADRLPQLLRGASRALSPPLRALRAAHSGHLGDYVVWLLLGVTLLTLGLGAR